MFVKKKKIFAMRIVLNYIITWSLVVTVSNSYWKEVHIIRADSIGVPAVCANINTYKVNFDIDFDLCVDCELERQVNSRCNNQMCDIAQEWINVIGQLSFDNPTCYHEFCLEHSSIVIIYFPFLLHSQTRDVVSDP